MAATSGRPTAARFTRVLSIGIGGSALGPMFVADALGNPASDRMKVDFIDNTDPTASPARSQALAGRLGETLCVVTSKSGGTPETRNGMLLVAEAYRQAGLEFPRHAVAITMPGSQMDKTGRGTRLAGPLSDVRLDRRPHQRAVGGRPAAGGAARAWTSTACWPAPPPATRPRAATTLQSNPAALMALMWYHATGGKGQKDMVVLPYKDRLLLFSRYLQQLVMESLGKQLDLQGRRVDQGLDRLRQQRLDRPARLRPATARGRAQLLRRLHPRAGVGRVGAGGRAGRHGRRLPARLPARHARRRCSRTTASR